MLPETTLVALGFTELESRLYCELLRHGPQTGYRLAQLVAKAPANTYQALKTLAQKGGVLIAEGAGEAKLYRPVHPDELLASLSQAFEDRRHAALEALADVHPAPAGEHVYQLQTVSQVLERARAMFAGAQEIILFDFYPGIYELMEDAVAEARARDVLVAGVVYDQALSSPTTPWNPFSSEVLPDLWPGLGMVVIADGAEQLIAQISRDRTQVINGIWSDSAFLSANYHSALAAEIRLTAMLHAPGDPLRRIALFNSKPPGLRAILSQRLA